MRSSLQFLVIFGALALIAALAIGSGLVHRAEWLWATNCPPAPRLICAPSGFLFQWWQVLLLPCLVVAAGSVNWAINKRFAA